MGKKKQKIGGGAGGLRPRRQRTQVQHYTDDIPGTFTKKKKRRRSDGSVSSGSESEDSVGHHPQMYDQRRTIHFDEFASLEDNTAVAVKEARMNKRKRPPTAATEATTNASTSTARNTVGSSSNVSSSKKANNKQPREPLYRPVKLVEMPPPTPPKTLMLSHTASVAPILPLASTCPLARHSLEQQYPVAYGRGLGTPQPPAQPEWNLVANHDFYFPEDYLQINVACIPTSEEDEPRTTLAPVLQNGPWPVCRVVTTVCSFSNWVAVGDSAGFVLIFSTGPSAIRLLTRLDTSASKREWSRQRKTQAEVENRCRHKPELLEKRSPFWATAKTPNAIQCMTWSQDMILILTAQEIEAIQLSTSTSSFESFASTYKGGSSYGRILWTLPVATVGGPRKNGSNSLLTGGELVGSYLELHKRGTMVLWNTWGVAVAKKKNSAVGEEEAVSSDSSEKDQDRATVGAEDDWPLVLLRDTRKNNEFVRIIPFRRQEEEEKPPPVPIKRSPGRPPKKKPKPKTPVSKSELVWTEQSKCHAAMWDNHPSKGDRLVIAYSTTSTLSAGDAQVLLTLLKLTDDISEDDTALPESTTTTPRPQFARLLKQVAVPLVGSARNVANVPEVTLQQSAKGTYTLVAGSRGVRMYETGTMTLLRVYGENVSLHGKTMVWKSCFVLDNRLQQQLYREQERQFESTDSIPATQQEEEDGAKSKTILRQNRQGFSWLEQENPLAAMLDRKDASNSNSSKILTRRRTSMQRIRTSSSVDEHEDEDQEDDESHWLHQAWIVGIPHPFRGPKELQETLYFWQGIEKLPLFTAALPHQSGGAQSILPLISPGNSSNRKDGMWLRFMVATVHGECMQLAPRARSDFAGIMFNPGYFVVQENVEYIEDEDELDKVMVEVREEKEEPDQEVAPPPLGTEVAGEIVDEELQEAIRLSLLESQGKSKATAESDEDCDETVVVQDFFGEDDNELVIPCEPEPFLRQKLLPEFESDSMMIMKDTANADMSAKDAKFASEILSILPRSKAAQECWDTQKDVAPPENILVHASQFTQSQAPVTNGCGNASASAFPGKSIGKSKRSRAGNLEMMMKASLDPELRQYMMDRSLCWADGSGARLQVDAWDHTAVQAKESEKETVELPPTKGTETSKEVVTEKKLQNTACNGTDGRPLAGSSSETGETMQPPTESSKGNAKPAASGAALSVRIPDASRADVEKEIALELLQLSPRPTVSSLPGIAPPELDIGSQEPPPQTPLEDTDAAKRADANELGAMKVAIIELKDYSGITEQYSCTGTVDIPLTLEECGLAADGVTQAEEPMEPVLNNQKIDETRVLASSKQQEIDEASKKPQGEQKEATASKEVEAAKNSKNRTIVAPVGAKKGWRCAACQGRMVIHTCGKRALPIDFEAIARQEKERKEREEEEKKRLKIEKRKQADAKRREAKKQKKEREKREKMEKAEELRQLQAAKIAEARANMANIGDCLETGGSPPLNGVTEAGERNLEVEPAELPKVAIANANNATARGGDTIHFAIADAWKEHAEKFTAKTDSATDASAPTDTGGWGNGNTGLAARSNATESNTLVALATMAEAATPQLETPLKGDKQTGFLETTGGTAAVPSTPNHPPQTAEQQTQHGFLRSPERSATSAAMIARRNQVLSSYHAMEAGAAGSEAGNLAGAGVAAARPKVVDLSNQRQSAFNAGEGRAHSFQISPMSNPAQPRRMLGQPNLSVFQMQTPSSAPSAAPRSSQPYFGYTQLSSHFRPRVNLGSYSSAAIFTARQRQPQPAPTVTATARTENPVPAPQASVVAPNRDSYFPGSQPQPAAAVASVPPPPVATTAVSASNPVWVNNPARALAQAMSVPGTMLVQPQLGSALAPAGQIAAAAGASHATMNSGGLASAQYHHRLRVVQPAAANPPAAPINPRVNSVVYNNPTTTTNP